MITSELKELGYLPLEKIQSLWSGYGQVLRCYSEHLGKPVVLKVVVPEGKTEHPRGWASDVSHQRKLHSYQVESNFYRLYSKETNGECRVPMFYKVVPFEQGMLLVMEDLHHSGFSIEHKNGDQRSLAIAIKWLANFHAVFMGNEAHDLWSDGGYWHLSTRQDEWDAMPEGTLKNSATLIDNELRTAKYQTIVHGDAKFANLCFHQTENAAAAVDFQYVGRGVGVKDLAYLVGSCLDNEQLFLLEPFVLGTYFGELKAALDKKGWQGNWQALEAEYSYLYPFAWADFYRFLIGWNPDSWKVCEYMKMNSNKVLASLSR